MTDEPTPEAEPAQTPRVRTPEEGLTFDPGEQDLGERPLALPYGTAPRRASVAVKDRPRLVTRVHPDTRARLEYWADRHEESLNDYCVRALEEALARENGNYDLPTLEAQRANQLLEEVRSLRIAVTNLTQITMDNSDTIVGLARGDSYLGDLDDDGEI